MQNALVSSLQRGGSLCRITHRQKCELITLSKVSIKVIASSKMQFNHFIKSGSLHQKHDQKLLRRKPKSIKMIESQLVVETTYGVFPLLG
jgi:hypothetical protein